MLLRRTLGFFAEPVAALAVGGALIAAVSWSPAAPASAAFNDPAAIYADANVTVLAKTSAISSVLALQDGAPVDRDEVRAAASTFIWALSNGSAETVWQFALEEEQESFGSAEIAYQQIAHAFPPLAYAVAVTFDGISGGEEAPTASYYLKDSLGLQWRVELGMFLDDAGDWKVVSCAIEPAPGVLI